MHVLIPAYQPTTQLVLLVEGLLEACPSLDILIVDDGSSSACQDVFAEAEVTGARVLHLAENRGKGHALRAGFDHLLELRVNGAIVTADADGQHAVRDILALADAVDTAVDAPPHLVLGERRFDGSVPLRSRVGNTATRLLFRAATGLRVHDTQTGLRAFPATLLPWLCAVKGDRYEYELQMLLRAVRDGIALRRQEIETIYLDDNESSHFRPVADSVRIYRPLLAFLATSLTAFVVDTLALFVLSSALGLFWAVVGARVVSGCVNFAMNRRYVFGAVSRRSTSATRYAALAGSLLTANYLILSTLHAAGLGLLPAKLLTEAVLVSASYLVQARYVFGGQSSRRVIAPSGHEPAALRTSSTWSGGTSTVRPRTVTKPSSSSVRKSSARV